MGNLALNDVYAWTADDHKVSETFQGFVENFVKTGNPNGGKLPKWPAVKDAQVMHLDVESRAEPDSTVERYRFLDKFYAKR